MTNPRFRIYFEINKSYSNKDVANAISSTPFWYSYKDFRTTISSDATIFDSDTNAINTMKAHAQREPMLHLMLEFYNYSLELRDASMQSTIWTPMRIHYFIDHLVNL